ncbi:MAG: nucleotide exchange factor GrpE [Clostridia bacterium]|nr:nucleotide exchange factor GrpE [Clostridia bacterium]MBR6499736.1 nucleotide exchange factor GrpE [Clostridia bacterium]
MKYKRKKVKKLMEEKQRAAEAENPQETQEPLEITETQGADEAQKTPEAQPETAEPETKQEETDTETPSQEEWAAALKKTVEERDSYKDSLLRSQAEFQNYKKRNASVRAEAYDDGVRETIFACLPAIDNLELALKHAESQGETGGVYEGVRMTLKQLTDSLGKLGLTEIPALGEQFDPELHNAVMRESGGEENVISEVFQKGYRVKDKIIRYAMVKVFSGEE